MEKVPQIVSERLRTLAVTAEHPDADMLTAFSEHSLREAERTSVLEHLAKCAECREIVALALPVTEPVQEVLRPAPKRWLTWPVLRWSLVSAGVLIVGAFGVLRYQRQQHAAATMAYNSHAETVQAVQKESAPLPAATQNDQPPTEARDKDQGAASDLTQTERARALAKREDIPSYNERFSNPNVQTHSSGAAIGGAVQHGPRVQWNSAQQLANNAQQNNLPRSAAAPAAPPVPGKQTGMQVAQSQQLDANVQSVMETAPVLEGQSLQQQASNGGSAESKVEKAKPAGTALISPKKVIAREMEPPSVAAGARISGQLASASPSSPVRWTINTAGGLQRSFDQGSTWQDVDVNSSAPAAANSMALMKAAKPTQMQYDAVVRKDVTTTIVFRAVAANGLDVWAGASGGLLYHSSDAGANWIRVVPSASGVSLTGDIVSLEFLDPQHGRVTTSTPEVWATEDAGQTWHKR